MVKHLAGWWKVVLLLLTLMGSIPVAAQDGFGIVAFELKGVHRVSGAELREALATKSPAWHVSLFSRQLPRFDLKQYELDLQRIVLFYHLQGFFDVRVVENRLESDAARRQVRVFVKVEENEPTVVSKILFTPADSSRQIELLPDLHKFLTLHPGERLVDQEVQNSRIAMISRFANVGYPFAKVTPEISRDPQHQLAEIVFLIDPGPWCAFGEITIKGTHRYPESAIGKVVDFNSGERFDRSKLIAAQQQIYRLELFESVRVRAVAGANDGERVPVEIEVKEARRHLLKAGIGYGTEDHLRASLQFRLRNFLGGARRLNVTFKYSSLEPGSYRLSLSQPHLPVPRSLSQISAYYLQQDETEAANFRLRRVGGEFLTQRDFWGYTNAYLRYRLESVLSDSTISLSDLTSYQKSIFTFGMVRNSSRPLFTPRRGSQRSLVVDLSGLIIHEDFRYVKVIFDYRKYFEWLPEVVVATRGAVGHIFLYGGGSEVPQEERFYAGGATSVRGWGRWQLGPHERDPSDPNRLVATGGRSLFEGNAELRYPIWKEVGGVTFVDFGNVWRESFPGGIANLLGDIHFAIGMGLRYDTPIGPARFDFGWKMNRQEIDTGRWEFHLSVGHAF